MPGPTAQRATTRFKTAQQAGDMMGPTQLRTCNLRKCARAHVGGALCRSQSGAWWWRWRARREAATTVASSAAPERVP